MKILIYSDIHISQDSSIIKGIGNKYSTRLEHIIKSLDWAEELAIKENCAYIFNLGDTFDKPIINAMEATAVQEIKWANIPHFILVGNHDSNVASLEYSSVSILKKYGFRIIDKPISEKIEGVSFTFLPYITQNNRKPLKEYLNTDHDIVLSHNDIAGFNFGGFISKDGFDVKEIENSCSLFLNGHLHNSAFLSKKILNVGNLCGQNFSEDAFKYKHGVWILNTADNSLKFYENPYSFNFYKLNWTDNIATDLDKLKPNSCVVIKCERKFQNELKEKLTHYPNILNSRIILSEKEHDTQDTLTITLEKVDHLKLFCDTMREYLGNDEIVNAELAEVCK